MDDFHFGETMKLNLLIHSIHHYTRYVSYSFMRFTKIPSAVVVCRNGLVVIRVPWPHCYSAISRLSKNRTTWNHQNTVVVFFKEKGVFLLPQFSLNQKQPSIFCKSQASSCPIQPSVQHVDSTQATLKRVDPYLWLREPIMLSSMSSCEFLGLDFVEFGM